MEIHTIENNIQVVCITAESFPDKVMAAHTKLHDIVGTDSGRRFFGISWPGRSGSIIYKAAAEALEEEGEVTKDLERFTIQKGKYISLFISNFCDDPTSVGKAFQELLKYPGIDHQDGYCLEIYETPTDVRCMVPLKKIMANK